MDKDIVKIVILLEEILRYLENTASIDYKNDYKNILIKPTEIINMFIVYFPDEKNFIDVSYENLENTEKSYIYNLILKLSFEKSLKINNKRSLYNFCKELYIIYNINKDLIKDKLKT